MAKNSQDIYINIYCLNCVYNTSSTTCTTCIVFLVAVKFGFIGGGISRSAWREPSTFG